MKKIVIISPCFNEEKNILEFYSRLNSHLKKIDDYKFSIIFIDNNSTDNTVNEINNLIIKDCSVSLIKNKINFGHIKSPYWGLIQSEGDATILISSDMQEPPELIEDLLRKWKNGADVVLGKKNKSKTNIIMHGLRKTYYRMLNLISENKLQNDTTGFGLYSKQVIQQLRKIDEKYPYLRGLISDLGCKVETVDYVQQKRVNGITKNNFFTLYDVAMLGIVKHSFLPIRIVTMLGFLVGAISLLTSIYYFIYKLINWSGFELGVAPAVIGMFFILGLILIFIGIIGEYIINITRLIDKKPIVVEEYRKGKWD
jgi:glycosyltransferase involved in cell wall biosynthesis